MRNAGRDWQDPLDRRQWLVEHPEDKGKASSAEAEASELVRGDIQQRHIFNENRTMMPGEGQLTLVQYTDNRRILQRELRNRLDTIFGDDLKREPRNKQEEWIQEYFNLFDLASDHTDPVGRINNELFDTLLVDFKRKFGPQALAYVNEFNLVGNLELENQYLSAVEQLDDLGYFTTNKFINMRSGLAHSKIKELHSQVSGARLGNIKLQAVDFETAAWQVLREEGYNGTVILDVINSGKDAFENPAITAIKRGAT